MRRPDLTCRSYPGVDPGSEPALIGTALPALDAAILRSVIYRDLFDYPVTIDEIHRYLQGSRADRDAVALAVETSDNLRQLLTTDGEYFACSGRESIFETRRRRERISSELWPLAIEKAERIASLPYVRMVAITGSLAVRNAENDADIDYMLVTAGGRLWSSRLAAKTMQAANRLFADGKMCINYLLSERALELHEHSLYVAQELSQMVPVFGEDVYDTLREKNGWTRDLLPNAVGAPERRPARAAYPRAKAVTEVALRGYGGRAIERWESRRKLRKYNETAFLLGRSTKFHAEATGHSRQMKSLIETAFRDRFEAHVDPSKRFRVLFGQTYHLYLDPKLWKAMQPFPPLGCLYAAAVARQFGHDVRVHDSMLSVSDDEWKVALQINQPELVVLYEDNFNYLTKMCLSNMRAAALRMIREAKSRGARVAICGSDSTDEPEPYLRAGADFVILGEGEDTLSEVLTQMDPDLDFRPETIAGLAYLDAEDQVAKTPRRPVIRNIDELPMAAWDLIDLERYMEIWARRHGRTSLNLVTTRGCPYHCNWCAKPIWGQRYNARSPGSVVDEISYLKSRTDVDYFWFMDDIFGLKPGWIPRFADALEKAGLAIRFKSLSRPDLLLRKGEIESLARAGCDVVWMGAESGSQKILDAMEKGTTVDAIVASARRLREHGIRVGLFIQFGYPGESLDDVRATIDMIRDICPDEMGVSVSYPLPGTRFYNRVARQLGETRHWKDSDDLAMLFNGPFNTRFYRSLYRYVHADLGMRQAWRDVSDRGRRSQLGMRRSLRKLARIVWSFNARSVASLGMGITARMPHRAVAELPVELSQTAASRPSPQVADGSE